jgi:hypothetical protein
MADTWEVPGHLSNFSFPPKCLEVRYCCVARKFDFGPRREKPQEVRCRNRQLLVSWITVKVPLADSTSSVSAFARHNFYILSFSGK